LSTAPVDDRSLAELEEERNFLLRSIEDLDHERDAGDMSEQDYATLKDDYTARAAAVLREIDAARTRRPSDGPDASPPPPRIGWPSRRQVLTAAGVVAFAVLAGALLARAVGERLPGQASTGSVAASGASTDLARARQLIGQGKTLAAIQLYDQILARDPRQVEALAYRGWLVRLVGREAANPALVDKGYELIDRAVAVDPEYPDARFFRGLVRFQDKSDPAGAVVDFRAFLASNPPQEAAAMVEDVLRRAEAAAQSPPPAQTTPAPLPAQAPPD
jgi:tetratricopeptide (TPR) repeat protein